MKKIYFVFLLVFILAACRKNDQTTPIENLIPEPFSNALDQGPPVLGKKLENPYSLKNMRLAYKNLKENKGHSISNTIEESITVTHYYVRFLPSDGAQYDVLKSDSKLYLYPIPLDYEIISSGSNYHDASGKPAWQYTAVKKGYQFNPKIKYEILEELYLPEQVETTNTSGLAPSMNKNFIVGLVNEAMIITKNFKDTIRVDNGPKTSWYPS